MDVAQTEDYIQDKSGVTEIISALPMYDELVDPSFRARKSFNLWTRNTIPWTLECDQSRINREWALGKIQSLEEIDTLESGYQDLGVANFN